MINSNHIKTVFDNIKFNILNRKSYLRLFKRLIFKYLTNNIFNVNFIDHFIG